MRLTNKNTVKSRSIKVTKKEIRRLLSGTIFTYTNVYNKATFNDDEVLRFIMCSKRQVGLYKI